MKRKTTPLPANTFFMALIVTTFMLSGCLPMNSSEATAENGHESPATTATVEFEPYYPANFRDLLIPGELVWSREKSVTMYTDSFKGGILHFSGRVEVTSLMEFFTNSMKNDGWTPSSSIKSKNVLLVFSKENSTCMIRIMEGGPIGKTNVDIYFTKSN